MVNFDPCSPTGLDIPQVAHQPQVRPAVGGCVVDYWTADGKRHHAHRTDVQRYDDIIFPEWVVEQIQSFAGHDDDEPF